MIPTNGVLIALGQVDLGTDVITVPAGTTHFIFGFSSSADKVKTHGHVSIGGNTVLLASGQLYCLHTHSYKPAIVQPSANITDKFDELAFFRIDTRP